MSVFSLWEPKLDTLHWRWDLKVLNPFSGLTDCILANTVKHMAGFSTARTSCWLKFYFFSGPSGVFSAQLLSSQWMSNLCYSRGLFWHRCNTFHSQLLRGLSVPFLQPTVLPLNSNLNLQRSQPLSHVWYHLQRYWGFIPSQKTTSLIQMLSTISTRLPGCQCTLHCWP